MPSPTDPIYDLAIIGGGAAGLAAAIFTAEALASRNASARIVILDSATKLGAKILVSGGARCNVTHDRIHPSDYNAPQPVVRNILRHFNEQATVRWFAALGVTLKTEDTGKLFPTTDDAHTVLNALLNRCQQLNIQILLNHRVTAISAPLPRGEGAEPCEAGEGVPERNVFTISHSQGQLLSRHLLLATGGRSLPKTGSDGSGYALAQSLNHTVTPTHPALVPLLLDPSFFHPQLSGISHPATITTIAYETTSNAHGFESLGTPSPKPKTLDSRSGSLLWTHFGISGPLAMDASRHWILAAAASSSALPPLPRGEVGGPPPGEGVPEHPVRPDHTHTLLLLNFLPTETFESVEHWLLAAASASPKRSVLSVLADRLPRRVAEVLAAEHTLAAPSGTPRPGKPLEIAQLPRDLRRALVHSLTALPLPVLGDRGWNYAEVTAGGIPLSEIDFRTMQSRKTPHLYLTGEILDCDGRIGGYNFQWAWSTAHTAAQAIAKSIKTKGLGVGG